MDLEIRDRLAVVTGAARGIGLATARAFLKEDARVLMVDCDSAVIGIAAEVGAKGFVTDVSVAGSGEAIAARTQELGGAYCLVNNAGVSKPAAIDEIRDEDWQAVMSVNLDAAFRLMRACWPQLIKAGGSVVNVASFAAKRATLFGNNASYTVSKHGIAGLTRAAAMDGAKVGIRVNAVAPGVVATDLVKLHDNATRVRIASMIPLGRYADPQEIADAIVFLASPRTSHITGEIINVNGGLVMD